jgi:hypothetical protein
MRFILAILDLNNNTYKILIGEKCVFPKPLGRFIVKNIYTKTHYFDIPMYYSETNFNTMKSTII